MTFWNERLVRAAKHHLCDECEYEIRQGTFHTYGSGINVYGEFGAWRAHSDCLTATLEQRDLAGLEYDEWHPVKEWVWELDGLALAAFVMDYPGVYERFKEDLKEHDRVPEFYTWIGLLPFVEPRRRRDPYVWERLI